MVLAWGCEPVLERQGVPVWAEVRYEEQTLAACARRADTLQQLGYPHMVLGVPLHTDSTGQLALIATAATDTVVHIQLPLPYALHFTSLHPDSLLPPGQHRNPIVWQQQLLRIIQTTTQRLTTPPDWIIIGPNYTPLEQAPDLLHALADSLRQQLPTTRLAYCTTADIAPTLTFWQHLDAVALSITHDPAGQYKPFARAQHKPLGVWLLRQDKPLLILQANLVGGDKTLKLMNSLRFWPDSLPIIGISLNTVYATPAPMDTNKAFFGFAGDAELEAYLRSYQTGQ